MPFVNDAGMGAMNPTTPGPGGGGGGGGSAFWGATPTYSPNQSGDIYRRRRSPYQNYWQNMGLMGRPGQQMSGYQPMSSFAQGAGSPAWPSAYGQPVAPGVGGARNGAMRGLQIPSGWMGRGRQQPQGAPPPGADGGLQPWGDMGGQQGPGGYSSDGQFWFNPNGQGGKWSTTQFSQDAILNMIKAGMFDPFGSGPMMDAYRQKAMADAGAQQRGAYTRAQLSAGEDPSVMAFAGLQGYLGAQDSLTKAMMDARIHSQEQNSERLNNLQSGLTGYNFTYKPRQQTSIGAGPLSFTF